MSDWRCDEWQVVKVWVRARGFEAPGAPPGAHRYSLIGVTHHRPGQSPANIVIDFAERMGVPIHDVTVMAIEPDADGMFTLPVPGSLEAER